jgi:PAS domain S-box-containing protein
MPKARILIVEDEGIIAEDIQMSLQDLGYEVSGIVTRGKEAIRTAAEQRPDLVLMDVVLQGEMDGIVAANEIHTLLKIPIIYLTAYSDDKMLERAKNTEPFGYLIKPFRDRELRSTIEMALYKNELDNKLRESQEWLAVTLNSIGDGLIATDQQGLVTFMNPVAEALTGWSSNQAQGKPLEHVFSAKEEKTGKSVVGLTEGLVALRGNASLTGKLLVTKNGSTMPIEANASPIRGANDSVIGIVLVFRDITQRKKTEERLRLLSEAVAQSSEGIAVLDLEGKMLFVNEAFAIMHGNSPEEITGENISLLYPPGHMIDVKERLQHIQTHGTFSGEVCHLRKDGSVFPGLVHNSVLRDRDGAVIAFIGAIRDITDIKASQEALRASHEALEAYSTSLEAKVLERTRELENSRLELKKYSQSLEKTNEALKIIIEGVEDQKKEVERKISHNLSLSVKPIIDQLKSHELPDTLKFLLSSLEFSLTNIFSSFGFNLVKDGHLLTPREIRICEMIRSGLSSKQIAKVIGISPQTILVHRRNIRRKLSLGKSGQNLASFLKANL